MRRAGVTRAGPSCSLVWRSTLRQITVFGYWAAVNCIVPLSIA